MVVILGPKNYFPINLLSFSYLYTWTDSDMSHSLQNALSPSKLFSRKRNLKNNSIDSISKDGTVQ